MQNVDITLRILFRPKEERLPHIYANIGVDYDERILPSITMEILKGVVVRGLDIHLIQHVPPKVTGKWGGRGELA